MNFEIIGKKIRKYRKLTKITQKQLAEKIGKAESSIQKYEAGKVEIPFNVLENIAKLFDIPLYALTDDEYEILNITDEHYKKKARFVGDTEMIKPPRFTGPQNPIDVPQLIKTVNSFIDVDNKITGETNQSDKLFNDMKKTIIMNGIEELLDQLNDVGQKKAVEQLEMLTKIPEYRKDNE